MFAAANSRRCHRPPSSLIVDHRRPSSSFFYASHCCCTRTTPTYSHTPTRSTLSFLRSLLFSLVLSFLLTPSQSLSLSRASTENTTHYRQNIRTPRSTQSLVNFLSLPSDPRFPPCLFLRLCRRREPELSQRGKLTPHGTNILALVSHQQRLFSSLLPLLLVSVWLDSRSPCHWRKKKHPD